MNPRLAPPGEIVDAIPTVRIEGNAKQSIEVGRNRLLLAGMFFAAAFTLVAVRLVDIAVFRGVGEPSVVRESSATVLKTGRADIVDRNGMLLATSLSVPSLYADPKDVIDAEAAARRLVTVLDHLSIADVAAKLKAAKRFVWIQRGLTPRQQYRINALGIPGLHFQREERRVYPQGSLTSHIVGFAGTDSVGLGGLEKQFDGMLRDGTQPLRLSVDVRIQHILREEIGRQMVKFDGIGGAGVMLDANTGEVVAMVSLPDFDPNLTGTAAEDARFNRATLGVYEMGSTFKIFNTALALDSGSATMRSGYDATNPIRVARFTINDYHAKRRWLSVPEIFMYSSNIGSVKMALDFGSEAQRGFMDKLGFLAPVSVELPERGRPMTPSPWRQINTMTIAFGHGIAVSPLHLASGVASMVNGGIRRPVTVLKRDPSVRIIGTQVISKRTSKQMRKLLRLVVENGTGRKAAAEGYLVGGKTGTAEKPGKTGAYARKALLSSFVAAFPMHDPRYVVLVMIDEPKGNKESHGYATGGWVAAPAVRRIVSRSAPLLGLLPMDEESPEIRQVLDIELPPAKGRKRLASF
ncbi:MAG: penicillin-binding protein 2 [Proteobacteria bacterium]|nr:penicillin-binding protein 2 [Pseudomonadota bacterium]